MKRERKPLSEFTREKNKQRSREYYRTITKPKRDAVNHRIWLNQLSTEELEAELNKRKNK